MALGSEVCFVEPRLVVFKAWTELARVVEYFFGNDVDGRQCPKSGVGNDDLAYALIVESLKNACETWQNLGL